jgi:hypothetical protein
MQHTITHQEFAADYFAGYQSAMQEIAQMGFAATRDKFNLDNPVGVKMSTPAYYYAKGQMQALFEKL